VNNLGVALSAVGKREDALKAAQEAVQVYRRLAKANPDAYLPDLARSLGTLGTVLLALGRAEEAADAFRQGAHHLLPHARALPQAFGPLLGALVRDHLRASQTAGIPPDEHVLKEAAPFVGTRIHPAVARLAPLFLGVVAVVRGEGDERLSAQVQGALKQMQQTEDWQALATALLRLLAGERDPQALTADLNLDEVDTQALSLTLAALSSEEGLQALAALAATAGEG